MKAGFALALLASACPSSGYDLFSNPTGLQTFWRYVSFDDEELLRLWQICPLLSARISTAILIQGLDEVGTFQSTRQSGAADLGLLELASNQPKVPRSSPASASLGYRSCLATLIHG